MTVSMSELHWSIATDHAAAPPSAIITLTHTPTGQTLIGRPTPRFSTAHWRERARMHEEMIRAVAGAPKQG